MRRARSVSSCRRIGATNEGFGGFGGLGDDVRLAAQSRIPPSPGNAVQGRSLLPRLLGPVVYKPRGAPAHRPTEEVATC